jgi:hypothetical protein
VRCGMHKCRHCMGSSTVLSQCSIIKTVAGVIESEGNAMKVALAHRYRTWMFALLPSTLGLGSAALWLHSLNWPLEFDEAGLTLRNHRQVSWDAIRKIGVSRSYRDGHVCQIRIHYDDGVSKIPVHALQDGQTVVRAILTMFARADRARVLRERPPGVEFPRGNVTKPTQEFVILPISRAQAPPKRSRSAGDARRLPT